MSSQTIYSLSGLLEHISGKNKGREFFTVYGIVSQIESGRENKKNILSLWDEKVDKLSLQLNFPEKWNPNKKAINKHDFDVGDIVRVEYVLVNLRTKEKFVDDVKSITSFDPFAGLEDFVPVRHSSSQSTQIAFSNQDRERVQRLRKLLAERILSTCLNSLPSEGNPTFASLVLRTQVNDKRHHLLTVCDGTPPCLSTTVSADKENGKVDSGMNMVVTIKDPTNIPYQDQVVVFFKSKVISDDTTKLHVISGSFQRNFGKSIRIALPGGFLDKRVRHRILQQTKANGHFIKPSIHDCVLFSSKTSIKDLITTPSISLIRATAIESNFGNKISSVIFVCCPQCHFMDSLENHLTADERNEYFSRVKNMSPRQIERLDCPDCKETGNELDFVWNVLFVLRDDTGDLVVRLTTFNAIKMFGILPSVALVDETAAKKVLLFIENICSAAELNGEAYEERSRDINWLIKPVAVNIRVNDTGSCESISSSQYLVLTAMTSYDLE